MLVDTVTYKKVIRGLNSMWKPHPGQVKVGAALFDEQLKDIFVQAGRNWGKTEFVSYVLWRWANLNPGSENYYFAPIQRQAKEIVWASRRMQGFGPREWIDKINEQEMRIRFTNGSFIKLDGSDNVDSYRGVKPKGISVFDEYKDFKPEFYDAYDPNRAAFDVPLVCIGTPPDRETHFLQLAKEHREDPTKAFFWAPTHQNPYISREWLEKKKKELYGRGEGDVFEREYMAKYVPGGISKIFPMLDRSFVHSHEEIHRRIHRDKRKLDWYVIADPAAASVFAVLFIAVNPYSKDIYVLDEIYEREQIKMSVRRIGERIMNIRDSHWDREWRHIYDEAETWFYNEMSDIFDVFFEPTHKAQNKKEHGLSLIKDILNYRKIYISARCEKLFWEMDNYYKDDNNKIPKKDDHLIDCLRYFLGSSFYDLNIRPDVPERVNEMFRGSKIEEDFPELREDLDMEELGWMPDLLD